MTDDQEPVLEGLDLEDLGEPIEELRALEEIPSAGFVSRLLNALQRRDLSSQIATLGWTGLGTVFVEFLRMLYSIFDSNPRDGGSS